MTCSTLTLTHSRAHTLTFARSHTLTLSHWYTPTITHTRIRSPTRSLSHTLTLSRTPTHSLLHSHTHTQSLTHIRTNPLTHSHTRSSAYSFCLAKVLEGMARGCWIVSPDWIKASAEAGYWLPEADYELGDAFPGAKVSCGRRICERPAEILPGT